MRIESGILHVRTGATFSGRPLKFGFLWWAFAHHKKMMITHQNKPCFGGKTAFTQSHKAMYRYKPSLIKAKSEGRPSLVAPHLPIVSGETERIYP